MDFDSIRPWLIPAAVAAFFGWRFLKFRPPDIAPPNLSAFGVQTGAATL